MKEPFSREEILDIAASLEDYHKIFYIFFEMASVSYDDAISTAAIRFHKDGRPDLLINREFWNGCNFRERLFIICHECLHVMLMHDIRNGKEIPGATPQLVNIAQDICINEMIVSVFGFDRDNLREWKRYCWIDTCFDDPGSVKQNETFYYYLELLISKPPTQLPETVDEHSEPEQGSGDMDMARGVAEQLSEDLSPAEMESIAGANPDSVIAGVLDGMLEIDSKATKRVKVDFRKIIRRIKKTRIKHKDADVESFVQVNRRFDEVCSKSNVNLPGKITTEKPSKDKLSIFLFMDISGSCIEHVPTFNNVYKAFDKEHDLFEITCFTFDVKVKPHTYGNRIMGGGGTKFNILELAIQEQKLKDGRYPDCVIVVTDGDGSAVSPEIPSRWIWLLTPSPVYRYIPQDSKKFLISNVIFEK